jgi:pimeloyl-ACP methyl ester carboxylesterase
LRKLLLLPGSLNDEFLWRHQMTALADNYHVLCARPLSGVSLEEMAQTVLQSAPPCFALVGYALGARVALEIMRTDPERIDALALLDASVGPMTADEPQRRQQMTELARAGGMRPLCKHLLSMIHPSQHTDAALIAGLTERVCRFTPEEFARESRALLRRPDQWPILSTIKCPTLILAGAEDPLSTQERNREFATLIPHAALVFLDGSAHYPMLEKPIETTAALRRWLRSAFGDANATSV